MSTQRSTLVANTVAPWAEIVPGAGPTTVDALLTLPDDKTPSSTLGIADALDGESVVRGFRQPLAAIFEV